MLISILVYFFIARPLRAFIYSFIFTAIMIFFNLGLWEDFYTLCLTNGISIFSILFIKEEVNAVLEKYWS
jgi:hypothetical protein